ncbi:MAG: winged helix-turn-helix domain-containing protein [Elusimicrobia bacterium]|nr:winged helix-turn-helix domain-containing protein [Elusimicrobiota bacterium]
MWNDIGQLAGDVWRYLDLHGETSTLKLRSSLKISQSLLFLALGWLGREGKIHIVSSDRGYRVSIKRHNS